MTILFPPPSGTWALQDAKARFSELVRRAQADGPQLVTVHGRDEVVVLSVEDFAQLHDEATGEALIAAMQACPSQDIDLAPERMAMPVRDIAL